MIGKTELEGNNSFQLAVIVVLLVLTAFLPSENLIIELIQFIILSAILITVPLGFNLLCNEYDVANQSTIRVFRLSLLPAGVLAAISFTLSKGALSGLMICPWFLVTFITALSGLKFLKKNGFYNPVDLCIGFSQIYLFIGGLWLLADRLGMVVLNFSSAITLLTGMHFHYAGFITTLIVAQVGKYLLENSLYNGWKRRFYLFAVTGVIVATPLIAAGITAFPLLEMIGAYLLAIALLALSVLMLHVILPLLKGNSRTLIVIASASLLFSMFMVLQYANSEFFEVFNFKIPLMVITHGIVNAYGFALCGILAFYLDQNSKKVRL